MADEFNLQLSAGLDQNKSKSNINSDLLEIARAIEKLKVQAEIDPNSVKNIARQLASIMNQKVVIDNVQVDASKVSKVGEQVGQNLGDSINKNLQSSLNTVKQNIENTINSFSNQKLNSFDLSKIFNLNRASIDSSVVQQVRNLTNEINALSKEVLRTDSDSSWEGIITKIDSLSRVLNKFGATRDLTGFKESLDVLNYFQNKKIFVDNKSDLLANTGLSIKELNNQFRNLGVTFTTVAEGSTKLDTIWSELFNINPNLQQFTNFGDQINAVVNHLKTAKEALYSDKNLKPLNGEASNVIYDFMVNLEESVKKIRVLKEEQSEIEQRLAQASNSSTATVVQNEQKKQQAYEQTNKVQKALTSEESVIKSGVGVRTFDSVKEAQEYFKGLLKDEQAVIATTERFGQNNNLTSFTVNIKRATGEVESLRYAVDALKDDEGNIERIFYRLNGSVTGDSGAIKQIKDIENAFSDYTAKLSQFKSTNSEILSGLTTPLSDFESKLAGLKNGTSTIDEVTNAYKSLNAEASNITKNFSRQLSPIDSAIRKLANGEETISGLRAEFKGLNNAPKEINTELNKCARLLENVKKIESQEGRTENWSQAYRQWSDSVDTLQAKLKTLRKEQSNVASTQIFNTSDLKNNNIAYMSKVYNTIEKQMVEINRLAKAKDWQVVDVSGVEQADGKIKKLTLTVRDAEGALKKLDMQREKLQGNGKAQYGLMQVGDVKVLETASQAMDQLAEKANKIQLSMGANGNTTAQIEVLRNNFTKLGLSADEVKAKMSGVDTEVKTLQSLMNSGAENSAIVTQFEKLQTVLTQTQNNLKQTRSDYSLLATEQQRLSLANSIEAWNQKNTRATKEVRAENDRYVASLRDLNTQMTKLQFGQIQTGFKQAENSMRTLNRLGASLKDQMKQAANSFTQWISVSSAIMGVVYNTKQAVSELKDLDDILTEISKTSDLTTEQLKNLGDTAFDTASKYGKKASDYLTGVQEMYRAGFDNAEQMAELSVLAQSAGDMDATLSNNYLMATNAAYKYKGSIEDLNNVLDSQNYITNNAAISMKDIADATTETASVAAEFGVQIDELSALIATATANTRESGSEVGTALKAILINLQDTTSKPVTETFDELGISMTKVVDGAERLKTPIELIYELADAYNSLPEGDIMRSKILNEIGQKRHANTLASILSDMEGYQKMLDLYNNTSANGSAFKEAEKSANNLSGSLNRLSNTWTDTVENIVNSDTLKGAVNLLNGLLTGVNKLTDTLGSLGTIGLGAGLFAGFKNVGQAKMWACLIYAYPC